MSRNHALIVAVRSWMRPADSSCLNCSHRSRSILSVTETRSQCRAPFGRPTRRCGMFFHAFRAARLKLVTSSGATATSSPASSRRTSSSLPCTAATIPRLGVPLWSLSLTLSPSSGSIDAQDNVSVINYNKFFRIYTYLIERRHVFPPRSIWLDVLFCPLPSLLTHQRQHASGQRHRITTMHQYGWESAAQRAGPLGTRPVERRRRCNAHGPL